MKTFTDAMHFHLQNIRTAKHEAVSFYFFGLDVSIWIYIHIHTVLKGVKRHFFDVAEYSASDRLSLYLGFAFFAQWSSNCFVITMSAWVTSL